MGTKKKKVNNVLATAKLAGPVHKTNGEELVALTTQQTSTIMQAPDYPNEPTVQAVVKVLQPDVANLDKTLTSIANLRVTLVALEATRDTQMEIVRRDRRTLLATITVVCKGDPAAIKAWGCALAARTVLAATTDAPLNVTVKVNAAVSGAVIVRCQAVAGAVAYLFQMATDPNAAPGWGPSVILGKARYDVSGLQPGHAMYFRVAVIRRSGGTSAWSDPVQVVVR